MPFLLRKTAANTSATVSMSPRISHMVSSDPSFTGDWELFLDCDVTGSNFVALGERGSGIRILFFTNLTTLRLARAAGNVDFTLPVSASGRHEYRIVGSSATNTVEVFQDNVSCGTAPTNEFIEVGAMMEFGNSTRFGDIYRVTFTNNGTVTNDYIKNTLVGGNDTSFTDAVGGNDGVLNNFPTDNSQWVSYGGATGVTADVTESSSDFSESSNASITANITAQITESASNFSESSSASFIGNISAQVTEVSASFSESSVATITNNLVTLSVTETSQDFGESVSTSISGSLSALVTELSQSFTESSSVDISANISAAVTELAQDFEDSALINLVGSFTVEVTETTSDFAEVCYIQLPVQRLIPRKVISVNNRSGSTIRVRRRSSVIRVR